ncbi:unnamed protein product, partial [Mesorhabditis belari]|uniref:BPTI/Kunitz inhibitor domain-containing protein n=1 Tax=Mesorhabditis belari TaxID=2138241 RepID=A0AAF3J916_9BILA
MSDTQTIDPRLPTPPPETPPPPGRHSAAPIYMHPERKTTIGSRNAFRGAVPSEFTNPCAAGRALTNQFNVPLTCNHLNPPNGGCPEDFWCHVGATFATTACCPLVTREDRCLLERSVGAGDDLIARWYYDPALRECKRFLYKGMRGNANNFVTKTQCLDVCASKSIPEPVNPCKFGVPAIDASGSKLECGPKNITCPKGHFCHIGDNPVNTACCEGSGLSDPCLLSINVGTGSGGVKRFYYNTLTKKCTEFLFKGMKGNENNFLSMEQCQTKCQRLPTPCPLPMNPSFRRECSTDGNECGQGDWCHIGHNKETTVCCAGAVQDPCAQTLVYGEGTQNLTRWYADPSDNTCNRKCLPFIYNGEKGNQNNFVSKEACEKRCKPECKNPCGSGTMLMLAGRPRQCSPTSPCPHTHWCHVGSTPELTVCCSAVPNTCELPLSLGYGNAHLSRFYFDAKLKKCVAFIYKGEGGNQNMFLTKDDCQLICPAYENPCGNGKPLLIGSEPKICNPMDRCPSTHFCHIGAPGSPNYCCAKNGDPCEQDVDAGNGTHTLQRFYYDRQTRRCREFQYKGTQGNANNFLSNEDCELVCPVLPNPCKDGEPLLSPEREPVICGGEDTCTAGYFCHVGSSPETTNCCPGTRKPCDLQLEVGEGAERLDRWFFDGSVQMCRQFIYKGMKGNANNFLTKTACRQACKEVNPCGLGGEPFVDKNGDRLSCLPTLANDTCPTNFYCHVGGNALTTVCCPRSTIDLCEQPKQEGVGRQQIPRWYYDLKQNRCAPFSYTGLQGNQNNFVSERACRTACPEYRSFCPHGLPLVERGAVYSCGIDKGCPAGFICHMSSEHNVSICCEDPMDFCLTSRDPGPCNGKEKRFGYHPESDTCVEYEYGGCLGTLNNFKSLQRCTEICCKEYKRKHRDQSIYKFA